MRKSKLKELKQITSEFKTIKSIELENVNKGFLSIKRCKYLLNNGKEIVREEILKGKKDGSASIILPITKEKNVILIVQPRVLAQSTIGIELPAGYIEENETPLESAKRELEEETGYSAKELIEIATYYQDQGCSRAKNHSFLALGCEKVSNQKLDKDEFIKYFECTYEEALELIELGYINDANSILTLERSKIYMKVG